MIINASMESVVAARDYPDELAKALLCESAVTVRHFSREVAFEHGSLGG